MKTIILMWNPEVSNVSVTAFRMEMKEMKRTSWEVKCHDRAEVGDIVYLVRCDKPTGGIVLRGIIASEPFRSEHWYTEGAHSWYAEIAVTHVLNPLTAPLITVDQLQREIPGFKWDGGQSGRVLRTGWAKRLNELWENYLQAEPDFFKGKNGYDFTKEAYCVPLDSTLFANNNTDIWLYINRDEVTVSRIVNLDAPEEEEPGIVTLDGRERATDVTFKLKGALKAFHADNRFELYRILVKEYSAKDTIEKLTELLDSLKIKYEIDEFEDESFDEDDD